MLRLTWLLILSTLITVHALRIQPGVRWFQRSSLKRKPIKLPAAPTHTKVVPEPIFRNNNRHKTNIPVLLVNKLKGWKPVLEQQPILSQATNAIDKFKARNPYAVWNATLVSVSSNSLLQITPSLVAFHFNTALKDGLLEQGVALFSANDKASWENTAKLIGHGMSWTQCRQRWQRYIKEKEVYIRDEEEWTESEVCVKANISLSLSKRSPISFHPFSVGNHKEDRRSTKK